MRALTDEEVVSTRNKVEAVLARNGINQWGGDMFNPYLFEVQIPVSVGEEMATNIFNDLFHTIGVLSNDEQMKMAEGRDYCACYMDESGETYNAIFNHPNAMKFTEGDEEYQFTLKFINDEPESEIRELLDGIKAGRLKAKSEDGYLVLKAEFYDAIESGKKTVEYRDFTEYNLKRTIGIKTVRFNRGYVKNAKQMRWEVKRVVLLDDTDQESDPFKVPNNFLPVAIAIHLGKRIA